MSDREMYCDRIVDYGEHYDGYSSKIILQLYSDSLKTKYLSAEKYSEYKVLKKYNSLYSEHYRLSTKLFYLRGKALSLENIQQIENINTQLTMVYDALAQYEASQPIQALLQKATTPDMKIHIDFPKREDFYRTRKSLNLVLSPITQEVIQNPNSTLSKIKEWLPLSLFLGIPILLLLLISLSSN